MPVKRWLLIVLLVVDSAILAASHFAQEPAPQPQEQPATPQAAAPRGGGRGQATGEPRPYDQVITKDAKTEQGIFTVHRLKDRLFYEIPAKELDKEFLWVTQIAKTTLGAGYGGEALGNRVVRWSRSNNKVFLRTVSYGVVANANDPIAAAVEAANTDAIIMAFDIEAIAPNGSVVIDV